jgi:hypothetical protein
VAKAPLFSNPLVGPFLRLPGALPVHRRQEGGTDPTRNARLFTASTDALGGGDAILIFPEGVGQPAPTLMPRRTGAARMLLTGTAARLLRPEPDVEATCKLAARLVLYPLAWLLEGWLAWRAGGGGLLALFVALLGPGGFLALARAERLRRLYREGRALLRLLVGRDLGRLLGERRRVILAELDAAVARGPGPVLAGREEPRR